MRKNQLGIGVPTRKFLGVSSEDKREISTILQDAITNPPQNPNTPWQEIGEYMLLATDTRWEQEIDPDGAPWAPNTPYTIRLKAQRGQIQKILQATGRARRSITYKIG
jgi:phage gpG-like protein